MQPTSVRTMDRPRVCLDRKRVCREWVSLAGVLIASAVQGQPVRLADPNLEAVVREILQIPGEELTFADMERLEVVSAPRREIVTLDGFVGATNLKELDLRFNGLSEVLLPEDLTSRSF